MEYESPQGLKSESYNNKMRDDVKVKNPFGIADNGRGPIEWRVKLLFDFSRGVTCKEKKKN